MTEKISVTFNELIDDLNILQLYQLPFMASQTLRKMFWVTSRGTRGGPVWADMRHEMNDSFQRRSKWTLDSLFSTAQGVRKDNLKLTFGHKDTGDGNPAAFYLFTQVNGGLAYRTKAMRRLEQMGVTRGYWVPDREAPYRGKGQAWSNTLVAGLWAARKFGSFKDLESNKKRLGKPDVRSHEEDWLYVPNAKEHGNKNLVFRRKARAGGKDYTDKPLPPGAYKKMGGKKSYLRRMIQQLEDTPVLPKKYDFEFAVEASHNKNLEKVFSEVFAKEMSKWVGAQKLLYG